MKIEELKKFSSFIKAGKQFVPVEKFIFDALLEIAELAKKLKPQQNPKLGQEICVGYQDLYLALKKMEDL